MAASLQLNLKLELPAARPLIPLRAAMVLLDASEDALLAMIEAGELAWAWDIASDRADRREIRIWRESILVKLQGDAVTHALHARGSHDLVMRELLPAGQEIRSTQLQRICTASQSHIQRLINRRLLLPSVERRALSGPNSYVRVTRSSVVKFLEHRRIL